MIRLALKKIQNNKWMMLALFAGMLVAILIACTIPVYSAGISHRMFVTQMEAYQEETGNSAGTAILSASLSSFHQELDESETAGMSEEEKSLRTNIRNFEYCTDYFTKNLCPSLRMPELSSGITLTSVPLVAGDARDRKKTTVSSVTIRAAQSYDRALDIVEGRMPSSQLDDDGCIEVIISRAAQSNLRFTCGMILQAGNTEADILNDYSLRFLKLKVVGIFDYKENPRNPLVDTDTGNELYCDYQYFYDHLFIEENKLSRVTWYFVGDITQFDLQNTDAVIRSLDELNKRVTVWGLENNSTVIPPMQEYQKYSADIGSVNVLLTLFYSPILILVVFFIFMLSQFVVENDKNEIAMLHSRGASQNQITLLYLCQGGMLALASAVLAPFAALWLCRMLGATSGFLEFAQRAPIKLSLSFAAVFFCAIAALLSVVTMLVPVWRAAKVEIVQHKQRSAGRALLSSALLRQILLGVLTALLLLVTFYAHYVLVRQQDGILTASGNIQPLAYLFLISFFTSAALLFILLYPFVIRLIRRIGKQKWSAGTYSALSRIARLETKEKFIVIFLTVTTAIGMFSGISARTMNQNMTNTVRYQYPCDIIADINFYDSGIRSKNLYVLSLYRSTVPRPYFFDELDQTQATKVVKGISPVVNSAYHTSVQEDLLMMAIDPDEFGAIIYWDNSILPKPLSAYLKMLKDNPESCILSRNMAEALGVEVGDYLYVRPSSELPYSSVVYSPVAAIVDAWPTYYAQTDTALGYAKNNYLLILNREAVEKLDNNLPYQVWMNTEHTVAELKSFIKTASAAYQVFDPQTQKYVRVGASGRLGTVINGAREVYLSEINAVRQGTNGSLTLGFLAVMLVCAIGFILYWVISIQNRTLQIGTMRALGLSIKEIHRMILLEQLLLCVSSVILGIGAGILSGVLFAPLLRSAFTDMGSMPPYQLVISFVDIIKLLASILVLFLLGHGTALLMLKRIRAAVAIKLGEE